MHAGKIVVFIPHSTFALTQDYVTMLNVTAPVNTHPNRERGRYRSREREGEREKGAQHTEEKEKNMFLDSYVLNSNFIKLFFVVNDADAKSCYLFLAWFFQFCLMFVGEEGLHPLVQYSDKVIHVQTH